MTTATRPNRYDATATLERCVTGYGTLPYDVRKFLVDYAMRTGEVWISATLAETIDRTLSLVDSAIEASCSLGVTNGAFTPGGPGEPGPMANNRRNHGGYLLSLVDLRSTLRAMVAPTLAQLSADAHAATADRYRYSTPDVIVATREVVKVLTAICVDGRVSGRFCSADDRRAAAGALALYRGIEHAQGSHAARMALLRAVRGIATN
jgi:hypothetical protein